MRGLGTFVNVVAIVAGTAVGLVVGHRIPERVRITVLQAAGLVVIALGVSDAAGTGNIVFPLVALVLGALAGEALRIEDRLEWVGERLRPGVATDKASFVEGFVAASVVYCVGPLTILGSISDGLGRGAEQLVVKAALDGLISVVFASTLGIGVGFSAVAVLVVQGSITAAAGAADRVLTDRMVTEMAATGGVMLVGIGIRLLDLKRIRVASFIPGLVVAPVLVRLFAR